MEAPGRKIGLYSVLLFTNDQNSDRHGYPDYIATGVTRNVAEAIQAAFEEAGRGFN